MTKAGFLGLLATLADAWNRKDYARAAACFAEDVAYADPTRYACHGRTQLLKFYQDDHGYPQLTAWHNAVFDEESQVGAAEYSYTGTHRYHGVALLRLRDDLISQWREYQHISERAWPEFANRTLFENYPGATDRPVDRGPDA